MVDVRTRLVQCFGAAFPDLDEREIPNISVSSVASWDSVATVTLVALVEEEFGVHVRPDDLEQFCAFGLVLDYVEDRTGVDAA